MFQHNEVKKSALEQILLVDFAKTLTSTDISDVRFKVHE